MLNMQEVYVNQVVFVMNWIPTRSVVLLQLPRQILFTHAISLASLSICGRISEKSDLTHFQNFNFKLLCYSGYELETCYGYLMIILLYSLRIPSPAHFLGGRGECAYYLWSKIGCFILPV